MLMTTQQTQALALIQTLELVKKSQLLTLLQKDWPCKVNQLEAILRQLRCHLNDLHIQDDLISWGNIPIDAPYLDAIDVMLALSEQRPQLIARGKQPPLLLRFAVPTDSRLRVFSILPYTEQFHLLYQRSRGERIILLARGDQIDPKVHIPDKCFFAVKQPDESYRFFTGGN